MNTLQRVIDAIRAPFALPDEEYDLTPSPASDASTYLGRRSMQPGVSSTLRKAMRARRIELGDRPLTYKSTTPERRIPLPFTQPAKRHEPTMPRIIHRVVLRTFEDPDTGERRKIPYLQVLDNSRYPPEKLRELRADGRHR